MVVVEKKAASQLSGFFSSQKNFRILFSGALVGPYRSLIVQMRLTWLMCGSGLLRLSQSELVLPPQRPSGFIFDNCVAIGRNQRFSHSHDDRQPSTLRLAQGPIQNTRNIHGFRTCYWSRRGYRRVFGTNPLPSVLLSSLLACRILTGSSPGSGRLGRAPPVARWRRCAREGLLQGRL